MKFKYYINEALTILAFWVSPNGDVIDCGAKKHINFVIDHPEKFGMTRKEIEEIYDNYNEPVGHEGKAREDIIVKVLKNGFIRIRKYRNYISVNIWNYNTKAKKHLKSFAKKLISGKLGVKERDIHISVTVTSEVGRGSSGLTLKDFSEGSHLYESEKKEEEIDVRLVDIDDINMIK
ncbi:MAG: hypothetical protein ACOC5T_02735 [Elusimicrobiota bacterium]